MAKTDFRGAMEYAAQNPNSDFARQLKMRIQTGEFDQQAHDTGVDLTPFGRPAPAPVSSETSAPSIRDVTRGTVDIIKSAGADVAAAAKAGYEKMKSGRSEQQNATNPLQLLEGGLKVAAGGVEAVTSPLAPVFKPVGKMVEKVADKISDNPTVQKVAQSKAGDVIQRVAENVQNASEVAGMFVGPKATPKVAEIGATAMKGAADATTESIAGAAKGVKTGIKESTKNLPGIKQVFDLERQNIDPRLETSATRLKEKNLSASEKYNEFFQQEQKAKKDVKQGTALDIVGSRAGDAFDKVIKMRRDAGTAMEAELKKVGNERANLSKPFASLEKSLADNEGLVFDKGTLRSTSKQSKMTQEDISLIETYLRNLKKLGEQPTVAELDSFMKRVPKELDVYKASKNLTGTTNGERIIKGNLAELREAFNPEKTGNPKLQPYYDARKQYSELSGTMERGEGFFGKRTAEGDFSKDASLVKSSVNSILNNGKKDFLQELEDVTGDPVLDEAVLALQAMKDSGNPQGQSLLSILTKDGVPMSKAGLTSRIVDWLGDKAADRIFGSDPERTQRFLKSLEENPQEPDFGTLSAGLSMKATTEGLTPKALRIISENLGAKEVSAIREFLLKHENNNYEVYHGIRNKITPILRQLRLEDAPESRILTIFKQIEDYLGKDNVRSVGEQEMSDSPTVKVPVVSR